MPNNFARHKKGYQPVSGALKTVRRKEIAENQRTISTALSNTELSGGNGTPSPLENSVLARPDRYDPYDKSSYFG